MSIQQPAFGVGPTLVRPDDFTAEILFAKNLIQHHPQVMRRRAVAMEKQSPCRLQYPLHFLEPNFEKKQVILTRLPYIGEFVSFSLSIGQRVAFLREERRIQVHHVHGRRRECPKSGQAIVVNNHRYCSRSFAINSRIDSKSIPVKSFTYCQALSPQ